MTAADLTRFRLTAQGLAQPAASSVDAVRNLVAMQTQDYGAGRWSIGSRVKGSTDRGIEADLAEQRLVRTWTLRGTLHTMAAGDVYLLLDAFAARTIETHQAAYRQMKLTDAEVAHSQAVLQRLFADAPVLDRALLKAAWEEAGISTALNRMALLTYRAALDGLLMPAGPAGKSLAWMPGRFPWKGKKLNTVEAQTRLIRRYVTGHGPVTAADLAWWTGLRLTEARQAIQNCDGLRTEVLDGQTYYLDTKLEGVESAARLHLLATFDEYLMGYADRSHATDAAAWKAIAGTANGLVIGSILWDGRAVGTWKRTVGKKSVKVEVAPFKPLTATQQKALGKELERYEGFMGVPVTAF